jgi:pimeloyl-ACP methyl ester carboxylesterase
MMRGSDAPIRRWADLTVPTLVIHGGASAPPVQNAARALAAVLPSATIVALEGQAHNPPTAVVAPVVTRFFAPDA